MHFINPFRGLRPNKENASSVSIPSTDHLSKEIITRSINYMKEKDDEDIKIINEKISDQELINLNGMEKEMASFV